MGVVEGYHAIWFFFNVITVPELATSLHAPLRLVLDLDLGLS